MTEGPTENDVANAQARALIAQNQNARYAEAALLALAACGPGWKPWMLVSLIPSDHRKTGDTTAVATALKAYKGDHKLTENSVFIMRMPDGAIRTSKRYEELFGDLLHEPHSTKTFEFKGQHIPAPRWELVWSSLEEYHPRSPEALAALRTSRERGKAEREHRAWKEANPLLTWAEDQKEEEPRGRG